MTQSELKPGDRVRLISSPERIGIMGNEFEGSARRRRVLVTFLDGSEQYCLLGALEKVTGGSEGPYELIRKGRFGKASHLRGAITHYRLSGKLANLIYSLNTTNTQFLAYQFKPVLQFLDSPNGGILIADEVGLGKTIEAGLIWTELRARQDARRLLVVCPAMLKEKWQTELADRFGVSAEIVDAKGLSARLNTFKNKPQASFALIAGIQGIRPPKEWSDKLHPPQSTTAKLARFLDDAGIDEPLLDMVIIDEAHLLKNRLTASYQLAQLLRQVSHNMVLLSATPIQLHNRDLFNLLNLLDADAFPYEQSFDRMLQANAPLVNLRDRILREVISQAVFKRAIAEVQGYREFFGNEQLAFLYDNLPDENRLESPQGRAELSDQLDRINPLGTIVTRTRKRDVHENRVERLPRVIRARMSNVENEFYVAVTEKVREFCSVLKVSEGFMLTIPQRQMASCMAAACKGWTTKFDRQVLDETIYDIDGDDAEADDNYESMGTLLQALVEVARSVGDVEALYEQDSKYTELLKSLRNYWKGNPDKKVVLFSFYRNTLHYLAGRLRKDGIESVVVHGGMDKQAAIKQFSEPEGPQIMLSSEVAAEGVDLQFSSLLINYDLPWNPAKIEQRIGRIDRIGQQEKRILIWSFVYENTIDERIYDRLLERLNIFRQALGSMGELLGSQIRRLSYALLSHNLTPAQEEKQIEEVEVVIANNCLQQEKLETDATNLIAHGDFIQNKVVAARELGRYIRGEDLYAYIHDFLVREYPGTRFIADDQNGLKGRLELSTQARVELAGYLEQNYLRGNTQIVSHNAPKLFFDNQQGASIRGEEKITQDHPLVRFVAEKQRALGSVKGFLPVSAIYWDVGDYDGTVEHGDYVYVVMRWSVSGARVIEKLVYQIQRTSGHSAMSGDEAEKVVNAAALNGSDWDGAPAALDLDAVAELYEELLESMESQFESFAELQRRENSDRIRLMTNLLTHRLQEKKKQTEERVRGYQDSGDPRKIRMIPLVLGTFDKERQNVENRITELQLKAKVSPQHELVSTGVIRIA